MFSNDQRLSLQSPLDRKNVRQRQQSGRTLDYIEGWFAITEANRIFGFDAWMRETLEIKCVSEHERRVGRDGANGWGVTYIAKVRITVRAEDDGERVAIIIREGCGTGHGIDRDLGQAHESALKEAETDAMKRALMTFGNPFGLALYDKEQRNVCDTADAPTEVAPRPNEIEAANSLIKAITACDSIADLDATGRQPEFKDVYRDLPIALQNKVKTAGEARRATLNSAIRMAG